MDLQDLTTTIADRFDLTPDAARDAAETYLTQIEKEDCKDIDRDAIADDDAEFVIGCVSASVDEVSASALDHVAGARTAIEGVRGEMDWAEENLKDAIRKAKSAGVPITQIAEAADLSRPTVYKILGA